MQDNTFGRSLARAFLAIRVPGNLALTLHQQAAALFTAGLRWMTPEQLHITLRFLGNSSKSQLGQIISRLEYDLVNISTFVAHTGRLCVFPSERRPRILALEAEGGLALKRLVGICEHAAVQADFCAETRRFRGHISLGRFRDKHLRPLDALAALPGFSFAVQQIELLESINVQMDGRQMAQYKTLHVFNLNQ